MCNFGYVGPNCSAQTCINNCYSIILLK
jgi:hypothetical protein